MAVSKKKFNKWSNVIDNRFLGLEQDHKESIQKMESLRKDMNKGIGGVNDRIDRSGVWFRWGVVITIGVLSIIVPTITAIIIYFGSILIGP